MEIRLTASVVLAVDFMMKIVNGYLGRANVSLSPPVWCNFRFFSGIKASKIERTKRREPTPDRLGIWELTRTVDFYFRGKHVASVELVGHKIDGSGGGPDNQSFWGVRRVHYAKHFNGCAGSVPEDWYAEVFPDVTCETVAVA